jgi:hypothetical protein
MVKLLGRDGIQHGSSELGVILYALQHWGNTDDDGVDEEAIGESDSDR